MATEPAQLLQRLQAFIVGYPREGRTYAQFWADFGREADELDRLAAADLLEESLADRYLDLLDAAHQGYGCPPGRESELMG